MVGEIQRFLDRGVAAADHRHLLAAVEKPVAGRAGGHALAAQRHFARNSQPLGLCAGADDEAIGDIFVPAVTHRAERRAAVQIDRDDGVPDHARADMLGLRLHLLHQPRALHHVAETGIVLDIGGDGQLPAGLHALHHDRFQHRARGIDRGGVACRAGADDEHLCVMGGHGCLPSCECQGRDMGCGRAIVTPPAARAGGLCAPRPHLRCARDRCRGSRGRG